MARHLWKRFSFTNGITETVNHGFDGMGCRRRENNTQAQYDGQKPFLNEEQKNVEYAGLLKNTGGGHPLHSCGGHRSEPVPALRKLRTGLSCRGNSKRDVRNG